VFYKIFIYLIYVSLGKKLKLKPIKKENLILLLKSKKSKVEDKTVLVSIKNRNIIYILDGYISLGFYVSLEEPLNN